LRAEVRLEPLRRSKEERKPQPAMVMIQVVKKTTFPRFTVPS
jgi:hypothetical protein